MENHRNPYRSVGPIHKYWYQRAPEILSDQETKRLLDNALNTCRRDFTLILFALSTGLRNTEVIGLNVEDVYPYGTVANILDLPAEIAKGKKPRRIPLGDKIKSHLQTYIDDEAARKRIAGGKDPLFRSKYSNKRLGPRDFQQILRRHSISALNHPCNPHMLRHTFATKLLEKSNIKIVQELLGHSCLQSTQIYLHPSSTDKMNAVNKLDFTPV